MPVSPADRDRFRKHGHLWIRSAFSRESIEALDAALTAVQQSPSLADSVKFTERDLWRRSPAVRDFIFDSQIGAIGAALIGSSSVRLIHDALFVKMGKARGTNWHRDTDFWAFEGRGALTIWIPLQDTPAHMALQYVPGSNHRLRGPLNKLEKRLVPLRNRIAKTDLRIGDVAIHDSATLHGSRRYESPAVRRAFAIHLIDGEATFSAPTQEFNHDHNTKTGWERLHPGQQFPEDVAPLVWRAAPIDAPSPVHR